MSEGKTYTINLGLRLEAKAGGEEKNHDYVGELYSKSC